MIIRSSAPLAAALNAMSGRSGDGFQPVNMKCEGCGGIVSMILRMPGSSSSAEADVHMLSAMYRCPFG